MVELKGEPLPLEVIQRVALEREPVAIDETGRARVRESRRIVDDIVARGETVYGVSTGFGRLSEVRIPTEDLEVLQLNLVRSHACGVGEPLAEAEVRMILLRINVLLLGLSGVSEAVVDLLAAMLNEQLQPFIPSRGSVGASGDLAPLAHLALTLIGEGEFLKDGRRFPGLEGLRRAGLSPVTLKSKDGLALLNGTQAMHGVGALALHRALQVAEVADVAGAMTLEGLRGTPAAFDVRIHEARPHRGQQLVAERLRDLLRGSEIRESHRENDPRVQDAYSLRCMPQVHGASRDALDYCEEVLFTESGAATDNPLIFPNGDVISGGNFHGAPLALAFDQAAIAMAHFMSISERRIDRLLNPDSNEGLPAFLARQPGKESGFMIAHVTAASLLNEARILAHPASIGSIPTSAGKEDHVSMGMGAALKFREVVFAAEHVLAIELLAAATALDYRRPLRSGVGVEKAFERVRQVSPTMEGDRVLAGDIARVAESIREGSFHGI